MNRIKFRFYRCIFVFIVACYGLSSCILWEGVRESPLPFPQTATFEAAREAAWHQFLTKEAGNRHGTLPPSEQTPPWQRPTPSPGPLRFPTPEGTPAGAGRILPYIPQPPVKDMVVVNGWSEWLEGGRVRMDVLAGALPGPGGEPTAQGVLEVWVWESTPEDIRPREAQRFLAPIPAGPLRIRTAVGERLILDTPSGIVFYFDVPTRRFVPSSLTLSPLPSPTP